MDRYFFRAQVFCFNEEVLSLITDDYCRANIFIMDNWHEGSSESLGVLDETNGEWAPKDVGSVVDLCGECWSCGQFVQRRREAGY